MNMCSKCHKELVLKGEQAKLAQTLIENIVKGGGSSSASTKELSVAGPVDDVQVAPVELDATVSFPPFPTLGSTDAHGKGIVKVEPNRCTACKKRVGLTGFKCRCSNLFCGSHRHPEKHNCPFDYRASGRNAIAKANPVVKAEKLNKI